MIRRIRDWLKSTPARLNGSLIVESPEHITRLSSSAPFPLSESLREKYRQKGLLLEPGEIVDFDRLPV